MHHLRQRRLAPFRWAAAALVAFLVLAGCAGSESDASSPCAPAERLVATSSLHVFPGAEVDFEHSPPAGGPHQLPAPEPGVYQDALSEPLQVGVLETGAVILQYQPGLAPQDVAALEDLAANPLVLVMPAASPFDEDAQVAFTSWGRRQLCTAASTSDAAAFVERFAGAVTLQHD